MEMSSQNEGEKTMEEKVPEEEEAPEEIEAPKKGKIIFLLIYNFFREKEKREWDLKKERERRFIKKGKLFLKN